jgi:hypothetical protein
MDKQSITDKLALIRNELLIVADQIRKLPVNPKAEQLGNNCISLNSSELFKHDKWTPSYYIFSDQYEIIAEMIESIPIDQVIPKLNGIIEKKRYYLKGNMIMFHPQVIQNLETLIKGD